MSEPEFVDHSTVSLIDYMGSDARVVEAARVSTRGTGSRGQEADEGLLRYLLKNGHWSPFEHPTVTFLIETPIFTRAQIIRHKSFSFNEESARYRKMGPKFYIPPAERRLVQVGKPGSYTMETGDDGLHLDVSAILKMAAADAWAEYEYMLGRGVAREVARAVLPQNLMTSFYMTGNLRSWIHFLQARDDDHAQYEVREVAIDIRNELELIFPITMNAAFSA